METIGRNDACWCGSGKKYKKCHCQFDEKLKELQQEGHFIPSHDMIKTPEQIEKSGFDKYNVDHTLALWPQAASGTPWSATTFQSKGDPITDLHEDMAAEQKARTTYDNILRLIKDPEVCDPIRFLREREIVHYQRFGESLRIVQDKLDSKNFYAFNPEFDRKPCCN